MPAPAGTESDHASSPRMSRALVARQVRGTKRVRLWHPSDAAAMYPGGGGSALFSRADPFNVDVATYPLLAQASHLISSKLKNSTRDRCPPPRSPCRVDGRAQAVPRALHAELAAGDVLYLPCGWWHAVASPRGKRSVSVFYWANVAEGSKNDSAPTESESFDKL